MPALLIVASVAGAVALLWLSHLVDPDRVLALDESSAEVSSVPAPAAPVTADEEPVIALPPVTLPSEPAVAPLLAFSAGGQRP